METISMIKPSMITIRSSSAPIGLWSVHMGPSGIAMAVTQVPVSREMGAGDIIQSKHQENMSQSLF
jgi:hypothetical protein